MNTRMTTILLIVTAFITTLLPISPARSAKKEKTWDFLILVSSMGRWVCTE